MIYLDFRGFSKHHIGKLNNFDKYNVETDRYYGFLSDCERILVNLERVVNILSRKF